jgi:GH35 family endo-1,4-beta-xylanase
VVVVDAAGRPVPDADVKVEMTRHLYRFGTAVAAPRLLEDTPDNLKLREVLKSHFNYVTIENHLKWTLWNRDQQTGMRAVEWLNRNGFEVRGHTLLWPGWNNDHTFPAEIVTEYRRMKATDPEAAKAYLRKVCAERVLSKTRLFAGKVRDWDVINETYANHDVMDELGREVMIEWFKLAREGDPNAVLYLNDYGILEGAGRDLRHINHFLNDVKFIKDGGAPIGGIGIQGHWGSTLTNPVRMLEILDDYAKVGLPIQITEFDINIADEETQALFTRDALITIFSHPSTDAFIKWGFWQNSHWLPNGAMFRSDWSKKPNALVWEEWVLGKWWTRESGKTDGAGTKALRGFMGDYAITVSAGGKTQTATAKLGKGGAEVRVVLP